MWPYEGKKPSKDRLNPHKLFKFWAPDAVILPAQVAKILDPRNRLTQWHPGAHLLEGLLLSPKSSKYFSKEMAFTSNVGCHLAS